jgi:hypothetical protein
MAVEIGDSHIVPSNCEILIHTGNTNPNLNLKVVRIVASTRTVRWRIMEALHQQNLAAQIP